MRETHGLKGLGGRRKIRGRAGRFAVHEDLRLARLRVRHHLEGIPEVAPVVLDERHTLSLRIDVAEVSVGRDDLACAPGLAREFRRRAVALLGQQQPEFPHGLGAAGIKPLGRLGALARASG